ncbi:MAG: tRNA adenosine(34) deaminase TadA [Oscillospiraceae bacterium]|nr:tRNA adenosine(34) deaminase TadA [Oscillospiraceae bacterium]
MTDEAYMRQALALAKQAADEGEVPVGCVITLGDRIVGTGRNRRETGKSALAHAELEAISAACETLGGWRLWQCTLYVTLEPCPMCAGAIINARIPRVVYGAKDAKAGSCESVIRLFDLPYNHKPEVVSGVLEALCAEQLSSFFRSLRQRKRSAAGNDTVADLPSELLDF